MPLLSIGSQKSKQPMRRAFTMVEMIAAIAIIAILVAVLIPAVSNFIQTGRETADRQTLAVLNDAINRYKMQGGDVSALTVGKPLTSLIETLQTPVLWNGVTHQFWQGANQLANVTDIAATGSGSNYRLTRLNTYENESGGSVSPLRPPPAFVGEVQRFNSSPYTHDTYTFNLAADVPAGSTLVLIKTHSTTSSSSPYSSIVDSKGNTWKEDHFYHANNYSIVFQSAYIETPLSASDTITINYRNNVHQPDTGVLLELENINAVDSTAERIQYSDTISISGTTQSQQTLAIACVTYNSQSISSANWTQPIADLGTVAFFVQDFSTAGSKTLTAPMPGSTTYIGAWVGYTWQ